jgi:dimethylaniline monooxygenase (N-oxide forming)
MSRRVAVVGAGPSGLVTVKELLEEGHEPICFERAASLGGVFRFDENDGVVWESCRLTSSGLLTAFSDYPVHSSCAGHMTVREYVEYLAKYCDAFDVTRHIYFNTRVDCVGRTPEGEWLVRTSGPRGVLDERYDAVAICSGLHQHPHVPNFPGQDTFTGEYLHGAHYRRPKQVVGKKVLVVGAGESGADIVAEVSAHAAETVLSLRRGVGVQSRTAFGKPRDYLTSRILNGASHWVFQTRNPKDDRKRRLYKSLFLPLVFVDKCLQLFFIFFWEFLPLLFAPRLTDIKTNLKTRKLIRQLLAESGGVLTEQFGTKTDEFVRAMVVGRCRRVPGIQRFEGSRVVFSDGNCFEPDLVIFCTGFDTKVPFLSDGLADGPRYLHAFNPMVGADLGFIGFLRPAFGAIPPLAELQARWFSLLQSNRLKLPSADTMLKSIDHWTRYRAHIFRAMRGRLDHLVDHTPFCDALARQIGCKPTGAAIRAENRRFRLRFFAAPFVAAQYRMVGPHAKPWIARDVISNLPIMHPLPDLINLYLRWKMSRALYRAFGSEFAPKLELQ